MATKWEVEEKIVVVDFAGTLIKPEIIEEANEFRSKVLERAAPTKEDHANSDLLYQANRDYVAYLTGLTQDMSVSYRTNKGDHLELSGKQAQNQIATNLFQIGMYLAAKENKEDIFPAGLLEQLKRLKILGFKLAIVSGVREDIIAGMLAISECSVEFDYIFGQPPILGMTNEQLFALVEQKGKIVYVLGDKKSDLEPGKKRGVTTIFVTWGHAIGGEKEFADATVHTPEELKDII